MDLDARVLTELKKGPSGPLRFYQLNRVIPAGYRELDRAIQRLRKAGKIEYNPKQGWSLVKG